MTVYIPSYTYRFNGCDMNIETSSYSVMPDHYAIGTEVEMLICPGHPNRYKLPSESSTVDSLATVFLVIGLAIHGFILLMWLIMVPMIILAYL